MKKLTVILSIGVLCLMVASCNSFKSLYSKYEPSTQIPHEVLGLNTVDALGDNAPAPLSWREFFRDPLLQQLIDSALVRNTDLNSARIAIEQSETSLEMSKKSILPSLFFSPSGTIANFNSNTSKTYNVPLQANWDMGSIGSYTNKKRAANAVLLQTQAREEAVRANLISTVAQQYCLLQLLDRQLEILTQTDSLWGVSLETQKALWENGKVYSTAVNQLESSCLSVKTQIVDVKRNIRGVENAICRLLAMSPQPIARNRWGSYVIPEMVEEGISAQMLLYRPDIRLADYAMEEAFYNMQTARSAFYPGLSLSGTLGWTNSAGGGVINPGKILTNIVASIAQPIFARGQLKGNLEIAKLNQERLRNQYVQTIIDAGNQVNEALADCQAASEKYGYYHRQIEVLHDAYDGTHELMDNGKAAYLEVLTAQESLLSAQLNEAVNMYDAARAIIALYIALGGATR
ncbi:MAG: TolC family protein [Muribaculaceae bacterium]|nr:TolC family protein [Muribaculaceae bacterium]